jgi:hypothetical protein
LRNQRVEKNLLENSQFKLSTDIGGVLKMHFGELEMRLLPTAPIDILWNILNIYDGLEVSKCSFL